MNDINNPSSETQPEAIIPTTFQHDLVATNVKVAMKGAGASSSDMWMVPFEKLIIMENFNVRPKNDEYHTAVRELANSIKTHGFYKHKPFACIAIKSVTGDELAIYDGHTRYEAVKLAISEGFLIERVPVVTAPPGTTLEDITVGLVVNNSGRQLEPMGLAIVCKRLLGYGLDNTEIAKRLGFTPAYVGGMLSLVGAPKKIRDMVTDGEVAATLAIATLREEGMNAVKVLETGLVVAKATGKTKVTKKNLVATPAQPKPVKVRQPTVLEAGLTWIDDNGQMEHSYALLSAITGMTVEELKKHKL